MSDACVNHPSEVSAADCSVCARPFCVDCLTIVDRKAICQTCLMRAKPRTLKEWWIILCILASSIGIALAIAYRYLGRILYLHHH